MTITPKEARHSLGLTAAQLATLLGISGPNRHRIIYRVESGERQYTPSQRLLLAAYLAGYRPHDWPKED